MKAFLHFLKKSYVLLLFIVLEIVAINFYSNSTDYTRAKLLTASNYMIGGIHRGFSSIGDYFHLRRENDVLVEELARMSNEYEEYKAANPPHGITEIPEGTIGEYFFTTASVINNSVTRQQNYLLIDKGTNDGIKTNMALLTPDRTIVGYIVNCSPRFSVAISVLNTNFRTSGALKGKDDFGSVYWDGTDNGMVMLSDISQYAPIAAGDTVSTVYSSIFPDDVMIGTVESYTMTESNYYIARVKLSTNMSRVKHVLVVDYADMLERTELEQQ